MRPETALAPADLSPILVDDLVEGSRSAALYRLYEDSFGPLRALAAARHVMSAAEFEGEMLDPRILKYTVWRSPDEPVALATITRHVDAMPWVSPDFFAARYPGHAARGAIYYLGLALVGRDSGQHRLLERVVREMVAPCAANHGVLAYDVCGYNDTVVKFGRRAESVMHRIAPVQVGVADVQTYYEAVFD